MAISSNLLFCLMLALAANTQAAPATHHRGHDGALAKRLHHLHHHAHHARGLSPAENELSRSALEVVSTAVRGHDEVETVSVDGTQGIAKREAAEPFRSRFVDDTAL